MSDGIKQVFEELISSIGNLKTLPKRIKDSGGDVADFLRTIPEGARSLLTFAAVLRAKYEEMCRENNVPKTLKEKVRKIADYFERHSEAIHEIASEDSEDTEADRTDLHGDPITNIVGRPAVGLLDGELYIDFIFLSGSNQLCQSSMDVCAAIKAASAILTQSLEMPKDARDIKIPLNEENLKDVQEATQKMIDDVLRICEESKIEIKLPEKKKPAKKPAVRLKRKRAVKKASTTK